VTRLSIKNDDATNAYLTHVANANGKETKKQSNTGGCWRINTAGVSDVGGMVLLGSQARQYEASMRMDRLFSDRSFNVAFIPREGLQCWDGEMWRLPREPAVRESSTQTRRPERLKGSTA
jgi:hypothetical protein